MNKPAIAVAAIALIATPAFAAKVKAPPPQSVPSWTGFYVGGNVGGVWENDTINVGLYDPSAVFPGLFPGPIPAAFSYDRSSWLAGAQIGYNYQITNWVVGIETDFDATRLNAGQTLNPPSPFAVRYTSTATQNSTWLGTTRARIGMLWNNVLLYATAGVAYARVANSYFLTDVPSTGIISIFDADSATQFGWTAGGGLEIPFGRWSIKGEGLWYDLGNHTLSAPCFITTGAVCATPNAAFSVSYPNRGVIARLGLNYHFNSDFTAAGP